MVHSDGGDCQWSDAKRICQEVLGYDEWFRIVEEQIEEQGPEIAVCGEFRSRPLLKSILRRSPEEFIIAKANQIQG